jgi:hypothetical protein
MINIRRQGKKASLPFEWGSSYLLIHFTNLKLNIVINEVIKITYLTIKINPGSSWSTYQPSDSDRATMST